MKLTIMSQQDNFSYRDIERLELLLLLPTWHPTNPTCRQTSITCDFEWTLVFARLGFRTMLPIDVYKKHEAVILSVKPSTCSKRLNSRGNARELYCKCDAKKPDWLPEGVLPFTTEPSVTEFTCSPLTEELPKQPWTHPFRWHNVLVHDSQNTLFTIQYISSKNMTGQGKGRVVHFIIEDCCAESFKLITYYCVACQSLHYCLNAIMVMLQWHLSESSIVYCVIKWFSLIILQATL